MVTGDRTLVISEMKEGQSARIVGLGGSGPFRRRLMEMGIIKGVPVYVEKYAPLRDPLELRVKGYSISLRVEEAARITVEPLTAEEQDG